MTTIMNDNTLKHKIDYKIDLDCSSISVSNMSNTTANMNANQEQASNSYKIESKISNILIDKKNLKKPQYIVYKMENLQINDRVKCVYTTKNKQDRISSAEVKKISNKTITINYGGKELNLKKENITELEKIDLKDDDDADDTNNEDIEDMNHQEQMTAHGYGECCFCDKELPLAEMGKTDDDEDICIGCIPEYEAMNDDEEEEQDEEEEEEEDNEPLDLEIVAYESDDEETKLLKQQKEIADKIAEIKYKKEAGQRKEKVIEWLKKQNEERRVELIELIEKKEQKLIQMKAEMETLQTEKTDAELLGTMNFETIYETINKKKTKKTTKTDGKKTCVGKGDIRISSKVLNDGEIITMSGKWTELGTYKAIYDKGDDLFYEIDSSGNRITTNNFENINKFGNHIYKNHQAEYENKKNMWAVMKLNRGGKWISMLDLPIIE